jgi:PAS domain S-box-containing protein
LSDQVNLDQNVMEYLLSALREDEAGRLAADDTFEPVSDSSPAPLTETQRQMALQLKRFTDQMPGGFFIYHADGDEELIYANTALIRLFGCETLTEFKELTGNSFRGIVHPDDLEAVEESIWQQISNSRYDLDYVEFRIIQKDGSIRWLDDYGHFIRSESMGDIFYVFVGDATERKSRQFKETKALLDEQIQKEEELRLIHQEHLKRLEMIEGLSIDYESIFFVDLDADWLHAYRVSCRFEGMFKKGCHECRFTGFDLDYVNTWVYPDDRELVSQITNPDYIREKLAASNFFHTSYRIFRDGKIAYLQLRVVNVGSTDHVSQIVMGYRNVDEEIMQEMNQNHLLENALDEATRAGRARDIFLSNMSHDIRTPMNAIVGYTALARSQLHNPEKLAGYLDIISTSSDQLLSLLNDVLEISRIESQQVHIQETECSITQILRGIEMAMLPLAATKGIAFTLDVSGIRHPVVFSDYQRLNQVLLCIADNAIRYTQPKGQIGITATEREDLNSGRCIYQFAIRDNGIGISRSFLSHIYEPFEREKNTTLSGVHGTGLGMTIVKKIVEMMGGTIDIESTPGEGSCFTITLALRVSRQPVMRTQKTQESPFPSKTSKKILLVDDNEINLEIGKELLKNAGYLVDIATDGSIAFEKIKASASGEYDLVLMDIQMPVMNGYDAAKAVRRLSDPAHAAIPIIALSANTFDEDKRMALECGMNAHLGKPIEPDRLYKLLQKFLGVTQADGNED